MIICTNIVRKPEHVKQRPLGPVLLAIWVGSGLELKGRVRLGRIWACVSKVRPDLDMC